MKVNRQIRAPKLRLIDAQGEQAGIVSLNDAMKSAEEAGLDLVEIAPNAVPPVCKIIDYGKFRYQQTKKEKESKKAQHQSKLKEVKMKPNIDDHDFFVKVRRARGFIEKGDKVRVTCMFRGREMAHTSVGKAVIDRFCTELVDIANVEAKPKMMGRMLSLVLAPMRKKT